MKKLFFISFLILLLFTGCDESASPFAYNKQIVVTGMIESGKSIDSIKLAYTADPEKYFTPSDYAITDATVRVIGVDVLFDDTLIHDSSIPGRYFSNDTTKKILPTKTYRLEIRTVDGKSVSAQTTVPDTFSLVYSTLVDNSTVQYNIRLPLNFFSWTPSRFHGTYLPTITSLDSGAARIRNPFFGNDTTDEDTPPAKIGYRFGLPKEQTYTELPWFALDYYGKTGFDIYAIDENYTQFLNQYVSQGAELSGIHYNIQGGIGIFWSRTQAKGGITVTIMP